MFSPSDIPNEKTARRPFTPRNLLLGLLLLAAMGAALGYVGFFGALLLTLMGQIPLALGLALLLVLAVVYGQVHFWCEGRPPRALRRGFLGATLLTVAVAGSFWGYARWESSLARVGQQLSLYDYQPFLHQDGYGPAMLDQPAALSFAQVPQEQLPRLDCATALYPVQAAFVQAVYPAPADDAIYSPYDARYSIARCTTTPEAYEGIVSGAVDMIFVAAPSQKQQEAARAKGVELVLTPIGREAFVFFVHRENPVESLTVEQLQGIYSGSITNWREVGGKNKPILAYQRPEGSGSQSALQRMMGDVPLLPATQETLQGGMEGIITRTAEYRNRNNALGYSFRFYSTQMVQENEIKLLALDGVPPTAETIRDGSYPQASHFYAVTRAGEQNPNVARLLEWILSPQGQTLIERTGYVGL